MSTIDFITGFRSCVDDKRTKKYDPTANRNRAVSVRSGYACAAIADFPKPDKGLVSLSSPLPHRQLLVCRPKRR